MKGYPPNKRYSGKLLCTTMAVLGLVIFASDILADKPHGSDHQQQLAGRDGAVPLLEGLYVLDFPVTTDNEKARAYFNQGLVLTYGFDHTDAQVSFLEAARRDPDLAMAYWGVAFVLGPNINSSMDPANAPRAYEMIQKAKSLSAKASPKERDLIDALSARYAPKPPDDRSRLDQAFAEAMGRVYGKYHDDPDVAVLYAESLMDQHPWDYWTADDQARPWTAAIQTVLQRAVKEHPRHPHTHHLYIHLMENSPTPEVTVPSADIILNLVPASGHLVHMAGHAYYAAGFYHDCSSSNERAMGVDRMLLKAFDTKGSYQLGYVPHVLHYLLASYMMEGRSSDAINAARQLSVMVDPEAMRTPAMGSLQHYFLAPYYTLVRFGRWNEILKEPWPDKDLVYPRAMLHYARGMALVKTGRTKEAKAELNELDKLRKLPELADMRIWEINKVTDLLAIASDVLSGEIEAAQGNTDQAIAYFEAGVDKEMNLLFDEPPPWYFPVRQRLGTALLEAGDTKRAEVVFREDLYKNADNPWSLYGLALTMKKADKPILERDAMKRFKKAWARADIDLKRPVF